MWITIKSAVQYYLSTHDRGAIFLLVAIVFLVYLPFLNNPFVFDDLPFIAAPIAYYAESAFKFDLRWFSYSTLGWTWGWVGEAPAAYRLGNLVLHALNGVALFYLLRRFLMLCINPARQQEFFLRWGAWIGATLFVCHPVAVYAVGYVVQRSILMATLFTLLMLLAYMNGLVSGKGRWMMLAALAYFLAAFSKEHSLMAPAMAAALGVLLSPYSRVSRSWLWVAWSAFGLTGLLVFLRIKGVIGVPYELAFEVSGADSYLSQSGLSGMEPAALHFFSVVTQAGLFFKYLLLWFLPNTAWMSVDIRVAFLHSIADWRAWAGVVAFVGYGLLAIRLLFVRGERGLVGFALLYPWVMFLIEFSSIRIQEPFVLYRSYLWLPGMLLLVVLALAKMACKQAAAVMLVVAIAFIPLAWDRLHTFSTSLGLWNDAVLLLKGEARVGADRIYYNRGNAELSSRNWDKAIADYKRVIGINEKLQPAYLNLGAAYYGSRRYWDALAVYKKAIVLKPTDSQAHYGIGITYLRLNNERAALGHLKASCELGSAISCVLAVSMDVPASAKVNSRDI